MNNPSAFSVNGAADLLERDRRTIRRALAMVPPDAKESGNPRWRLRTILDALDAHERRTRHERSWTHDGDRDAVIVEIERITAKLEAGFDRMRQSSTWHDAVKWPRRLGHWLAHSFGQLSAATNSFRRTSDFL